MNTILNQKLMSEGYLELNWEFALEVKELVLFEHYLELDLFFKNECKTTGRLFHFLNNIFPIDHLEHIIAVREAPNDEDGIWHDDGSRLLGFSLSLNIDHENILGGNLEFKQKDQAETLIFTPRPYSTIIIFLTGQFGYEHKVSQVTKGKRTVIAGWGSK